MRREFLGHENVNDMTAVPDRICNAGVRFCANIEGDRFDEARDAYNTMLDWVAEMYERKHGEGSWGGSR